MSNLERLNADYNSISDIDLSHAPKLVELQLGGIAWNAQEENSGREPIWLERLDLSNTPFLERLDLYENKVSNLDVSRLSNLKLLRINSILPEDLDLGDNHALTTLHVDFPYDNSELTEIQLPEVCNLADIRINNFHSTDIDISHCLDLYLFEISGKSRNLVLPGTRAESPLFRISSETGNIIFNDSQSKMTLDISGTTAQGIDLTPLTNLISLSMWENTTTNISFPTQHIIQEIGLHYNQLAQLNIPPSDTLKSLVIEGEPLLHLDIRNQKSLERLSFHSQTDSSAIFQELPRLRELYISGLIDLKVYELPLLERLDITRSLIDTIDLSSSPNLIRAEIQSDTLQSITLNNPNLEYLWLTGNFRSINLINTTAIHSLALLSPSLHEIEVTPNEHFSYLEIEAPIASIDLSQIVSISNLRMQSENLQDDSIQLPSNVASLSLNTPAITDLGFINSISLKSIELMNLNIDKLSLSEFSNLIEISLSSMPITFFDTAKFDKLEKFSTQFTKIQSLDFSQNPSLEEIGIFSTLVSSVHFGDLPNLRQFYSYQTLLSSLDFSTTPSIEAIQVANAPLATIDLAGAMKLKTLRIYGSELTELDISSSPNITDFEVHTFRLCDDVVFNGDQLIQCKDAEN